jgi:hypothetical protein
MTFKKFARRNVGVLVLASITVVFGVFRATARNSTGPSANISLPAETLTSEGATSRQRIRDTAENGTPVFDQQAAPPSCSYNGSSACGGSENNKCPKNQRYFTWTCTNGIRGAGCRSDTACN